MNKSEFQNMNLLDQLSFPNLSTFFNPPTNDFNLNPLLTSLNSFLNQQYMENVENETLSHKISNLASSPNYYPEYKKNVNYYHEFWLMYLQNELIIAKMKDYVNEIKTIQSKIFHFEEVINSIEKNGHDNMLSSKSMKKKNRRTAAQIEKEFKCPYENCAKTYGSDVSLNLHIKLKHGGGNKTEREKLAKNFIVAKLLGDKEKAEFATAFPPGYLENFYAFHKNKRKKNFDAKELLKQCDINEAQKMKLLEFLKKDEKSFDNKAADENENENEADESKDKISLSKENIVENKK